jgi:hypothetical protein
VPPPARVLSPMSTIGLHVLRARARAGAGVGG